MSDTGFDPWTATHIDAMQAQAGNAELRSTAFDPLTQWNIARRVEQLQSKCEGSRGKRHVPGCLALCLRNHLVVPTWLSGMFNECCQRVERGQALSWDEAFDGRPWPKGTRRLKIARDLWLKPLIVQRVDQIRAADKSPSTIADVFEQVAEARDVPVSGSVVRRLYYAARRERLGAGVCDSQCRSDSRKSRNNDSSNGAPRGTI